MEAIDRDAEICPALGELYSLMGKDSAGQADKEIAELMDMLPGCHSPSMSLQLSTGPNLKSPLSALTKQILGVSLSWARSRHDTKKLLS